MKLLGRHLLRYGLCSARLQDASNCRVVGAHTSNNLRTRSGGNAAITSAGVLNLGAFSAGTERRPRLLALLRGSIVSPSGMPLRSTRSSLYEPAARCRRGPPSCTTARAASAASSRRGGVEDVRRCGRQNLRREEGSPCRRERANDRRIRRPRRSGKRHALDVRTRACQSLSRACNAVCRGSAHRMAVETGDQERGEFG